MRAVPRRREAALLVLATLAALVPFLGKPFNVDDPLFVWLGQHLQAHPIDFYRFPVNWDGEAEPMYAVTKNPPLAGYVVAGAAAAFGFREWALHAVFLVPALAAVLGTYAIASRLCRHPFEAALLAGTAPVFLVCATSVMCDVTSLAFFTWALAAWLAGIERERRRLLVLSGFLAAAAALTKYFGASVILLCFVSGWLTHRRLGAWCLPLLIPLAALGAYEALTFAAYGRPLFTDAAGYAAAGGEIGKPSAVLRTAIGLAFLGACFVSAIFYSPFLWSRWVMAGAAALLAVCAWFLDGELRSSTGATQAVPLPAATALQTLLAGSAGAGLLAAGALDSLRTRDPGGRLLALWLFGTFVFAAFLNWTTNGRSILPLVPAAAILLVRRLELRFPAPSPRRLAALRLAFVPGLAVALVVTWADARWAGAIRDEAQRLLARHHTGAQPLRFDGHWGFQYYLERGGARPLDVSRDVLRAGELIAVADNNVPRLPTGGPLELVETIEAAEPAWVSTHSWRTGAGFYASAFGPLPYAFGRREPDRYRVYRVQRPFYLVAGAAGELWIEELPAPRMAPARPQPGRTLLGDAP
jgi:hypothetical protein